MIEDRCYRVTFEPLSKEGMSTNTMMYCLCCGKSISTTGGGGEFICDNCHQLMYARKFWTVARTLTLTD